MTPGAGKNRHLLTVCLTKVYMIIWNPIGIPTRSMENMKWYSPSQVLTAKHVLYPQLTATSAVQGFELIQLGQYKGGRFSSSYTNPVGRFLCYLTGWRLESTKIIYRLIHVQNALYIMICPYVSRLDLVWTMTVMNVERRGCQHPAHTWRRELWWSGSYRRCLVTYHSFIHKPGWTHLNSNHRSNTMRKNALMKCNFKGRERWGIFTITLFCFDWLIFN